MKQRFFRSDRVAKAWEIDLVLRDGKRLRSEAVTLNWRPRTGGCGGARFCVSVRKKAAASAPVRNRAKRLAREFFRQNKKDFRAGMDIVLQVHKCDIQNYKELEKQLAPIFRKTGLLDV